MNPDQLGQSIWDSELESLAIAIYCAINRLGGEGTWKHEPHDEQALFLNAALAARTHMTNTAQENHS